MKEKFNPRKEGIGFIKPPEKATEKEFDKENEGGVKKNKLGFIPEAKGLDPFAEAKTREELSALKDRILEEIENKHNQLFKQGKGNQAEYDAEWDKFYKLYEKKLEKITFKKKIGFAEESHKENTFVEAETMDRLNSLWDREEKKLDEKYEEIFAENEGDIKDYDEEWDKLYELYKERAGKVKRKKEYTKKKPGFLY